MPKTPFGATGAGPAEGAVEGLGPRLLRPLQPSSALPQFGGALAVGGLGPASSHRMAAKSRAGCRNPKARGPARPRPPRRRRRRWCRAPRPRRRRAPGPPPMAAHAPPEAAHARHASSPRFPPQAVRDNRAPPRGSLKPRRRGAAWDANGGARQTGVPRPHPRQRHGLGARPVGDEPHSGAHTTSVRPHHNAHAPSELRMGHTGRNAVRHKAAMQTQRSHSGASGLYRMSVLALCMFMAHTCHSHNRVGSAQAEAWA